MVSLIKYRRVLESDHLNIEDFYFDTFLKGKYVSDSEISTLHYKPFNEIIVFDRE